MQIERSCHLTPYFGCIANCTWEASEVLNQASAFYINPYLHHNDFYFFRYCLYRYQKTLADRQKELAQKRACRLN